MDLNTINADVTLVGEGAQPLLANRYRVVKQLGQGGMGSVWLAEDTVLNDRKVAVKMLPPVLFRNKRAYAQLKSEALMAMKLSHANIAAVRSFEENNGNPFIVEDYIEGWTLDNLLAENGGRMAESAVIDLLVPIASALDYAHEKGIVHRDVKPGNIIIDGDGVPYILDFGIARESQETMTRMTGNPSSGTLLYMSPEQLKGSAPKPAQDVYSFAAMVYECLVGHPPFYRGQIGYQIVNEAVPPLPDGCALAGPVLSGLDKQPDNRPSTCLEVLVMKDEATAGPVRSAGMSSRQSVKPSTRSASSSRRLESLLREEPAPRVSWLKKMLVGVLACGVFAAIVLTIAPRPRPKAHQAVPVVNSPVSEEVPGMRAGDVKTVTLPGGAKLELVWCPAGEFMMGSPITENDRGSNEAQHKVTLPKGFWLGKYEVTQAQWQSVMGGNPSLFKGADHPVEHVSWYNCQEFFKKTGLGLRLPTEAEWEYACRAGTTHEYAGPLDDMAWYGNNSDSKSHPVGRKKPNAWGLYDMHGNVFEWCADWLGDYNAISVVDPMGPATGVFRVTRGGSLHASARDCRSAGRGRAKPDLSSSHHLGFRVACSEVPRGKDGAIVSRVGGTTDDRIPRVALQPSKYKVGETRAVFLPDGAKLELVWCPPGEFVMGSPETENGRGSDETLHKVTLTKGFWLGKYEVTQRQWMSVMGTNSSRFKGTDLPVEMVSWNDCQEFLRKAGHGLRLPTEAEWEYACRAGTTNAFADTLGEVAWYKFGSGCATHPVGQKKPNAWGLYDMHGNVWEWCQDWYGGYQLDAVVDPTGPSSGSDHSNRGGGWDSREVCCRSANREGGNTSYRFYNLGFRVACSLP